MSGDTRQTRMAEQLRVGLDRVETRPDGCRVWPELYYDQPLGFRALTLRLTVPPPAARPYPLVVYIHGGGWMLGHPNVTNPTLDAMAIKDTLVASGYAVAAISYRLAGEGAFPTQIRDCRAAVHYLRANADRFGIASARIAALGESAGGHLALLLGMNTPDAFDRGPAGDATNAGVAAVVNWYGITDLTTIAGQAGPDLRERHEAPDSALAWLLGGPVADRPDAAQRASPVTHISRAAAPCLTQHGTHDTVVPVEQGRQLHQALTESGIDSELDEIPGADHCFTGVDTAPILPRAIRFLDARLRD